MKPAHVGVDCGSSCMVVVLLLPFCPCSFSTPVLLLLLLLRGFFLQRTLTNVRRPRTQPSRPSARSRRAVLAWPLPAIVGRHTCRLSEEAAAAAAAAAVFCCARVVSS